MNSTPLDPPELPERAALFLDLDGTLVPIAPRPQDVRVPSWVVPALQNLRTRLDGAVAVVSGRPLAQVDALLHPLRLPAAGVHGVERRLSDGRLRVHGGEPPSTVREAAQALVDHHPGLMLELKPGGLALHYRALPELNTLCSQRLTDALAGHPEWELMSGHSVFEVKQRRISKGAVLRAFLGEDRFVGRIPVYVGDDTTDEDGIREAQACGGFGVKVGDAPTAARHRLPNPQAVGRWLMAAAPEAHPVPVGDGNGDGS